MVHLQSLVENYSTDIKLMITSSPTLHKNWMLHLTTMENLVSFYQDLLPAAFIKKLMTPRICPKLKRYREALYYPIRNIKPQGISTQTNIFHQMSDYQ